MNLFFTDDFEVSLFLANSGTRHTVMTKRKALRSAPRLLANSSRLTGGHDSVHVEIRQEPLDSPGIGLGDIPAMEDRGGDSSSDSDPYAPALKRQKTPVVVIPDGDPDGDTDSLFDLGSGAEDDDKKKLGLDTEYEGFNIYSRILCIVVKRRGATGRRPGTTAAPEAVARGKVMEEWISMSQAIKDGD